MFENSKNDPKAVSSPESSEQFVISEESYEKQLKRKQDAFLDSYMFYKQGKKSIAKSILERNVIELELVDPNFTFRID